MSYELKQMSADGAEPVSLDEAKLWLRLENDEEDSLVGGLITAARQYAENYCRRSFLVGETWQLTLDRFPRLELAAIRERFPESEIAAVEPWRLTDWIQWSGVDLPNGPVQAIGSVVYVDVFGQQQTLDASSYVLLGNRLHPAYGVPWPETQAAAGAIVITYDAGEGAEQLVKVALRQIISHWYQNRDAVTQLNTAPQEVPLTANRILAPYREMRL